MDPLVDDVIVYMMTKFLDVLELYALFQTCKKFLEFKNNLSVKNWINTGLLGQRGLELIKTMSDPSKINDIKIVNVEPVSAKLIKRIMTVLELYDFTPKYYNCIHECDIITFVNKHQCNIIVAYSHNLDKDYLKNMIVFSFQKPRLAERIRGKESKIRANLMGMRVNFTGRTVITSNPNINLNLNELEIPTNYFD